MSTAYPYTTNYDTAFGFLELIDIAKVRDGVTVDWFNQTLCQVNDSVVRLGVVKGEYHWHKHDKEDEFFFVVEGTLLIIFEGTVDSSQTRTSPFPGAYFTAPEHRSARPS